MTDGITPRYRIQVEEDRSSPIHQSPHMVYQSTNHTTTTSTSTPSHQPLQQPHQIPLPPMATSPMRLQSTAPTSAVMNHESVSDSFTSAGAAVAVEPPPPTAAVASVLSSPRRVLRLMEELTEHILAGLLDIHYDEERYQAEEVAHAESYRQLKAEAILAGEDVPPITRCYHRHRPKQNIVIQYQPSAKNAYFNEQGEMIFHPAAIQPTTSTTTANNSTIAATSAAASARMTNQMKHELDQEMKHEHTDSSPSSGLSGSFVFIPASTSPSTASTYATARIKHEDAPTIAHKAAVVIKPEGSHVKIELADDDEPLVPPELTSSHRWTPILVKAKRRTRTKRKRPSNSGSPEDSQDMNGGDGEEGGGSGSQGLSQQEETEPKDENSQQDGSQPAAAVTNPVYHARLSYPSRRYEKSFAGLVTSMADCYIAIQDSAHQNKRTIHYKDKQLFPNQQDSDNSLDLLCNILQVRSDELNVIATSKCQVMGAFWYEVAAFAEMNDDEDNESGLSTISKSLKVDKADCNSGAVLTPFVHHITGMSCDVDWVLFVEKDTVWSKIAQSGFPQLHRCLLITDRGMPSKSTRRFLKKFTSEFPAIPIYGLFDPDPSGLGIFSVCKYGARRTVHENLAIPTMQLLGVSIRDLDELGILQLSNVGMKLTAKDRKKLETMLQSEIGLNDPIIRRECESMLALDRKGEIEGLDAVDEDYLTNEYLIKKLQQIIQTATNTNHVAQTTHETSTLAHLPLSQEYKESTSESLSFLMRPAAAGPTVFDLFHDQFVNHPHPNRPSTLMNATEPYALTHTTTPSTTSASAMGLAPMELDEEEF